jgi:hypothetical protein
VKSDAPVSLMRAPWVVHVPGVRRTLKCTVCGKKETVEMDRPKETGIEELRWIAEFNEKVDKVLAEHEGCGSPKEGE